MDASPSDRLNRCLLPKQRQIRQKSISGCQRGQTKEKETQNDDRTWSVMIVFIISVIIQFFFLVLFFRPRKKEGRKKNMTPPLLLLPASDAGLVGLSMMYWEEGGDQWSQPASYLFYLFIGQLFLAGYWQVIEGWAKWLHACHGSRQTDS